MTSEPSTRMRPASAVSKPAITFSSVVLPEPLGPRMVTNSPAAYAEADFGERRHLAEALARRFDVQAARLRCRAASWIVAHADGSAFAARVAQPCRDGGGDHALDSIHLFQRSPISAPFLVHHSWSSQSCFLRLSGYSGSSGRIFSATYWLESRCMPE